MPTDMATLTADALLELPRPPHGKHYELSDGALITVGNAGALNELIKTTVFEILTEHRLRAKSGRAFAETQFSLRADGARIPNVARVVEQRLSQIPRGNQAIAIAPDVAIEIVSDSEQPNETERRLRDYLDAGVEVWQVFPPTLTVTIWKGNHGTRLEGSQVVTSEKLPGFSVAASELFR